MFLLGALSIIIILNYITLYYIIATKSKGTYSDGIVILVLFAYALLIGFGIVLDIMYTIE